MRRTLTMIAPTIARLGNPPGKVISMSLSRRRNGPIVLEATPITPMSSSSRAAKVTFQREPAALFTVIEPSF